MFIYKQINKKLKFHKIYSLSLLYLFSKNSKKNIISSMENINTEQQQKQKDQEEFKKLLNEMGIQDKNMPDIPLKQLRVTRYIVNFKILVSERESELLL